MFVPISGPPKSTFGKIASIGAGWPRRDGSGVGEAATSGAASGDGKTEITGAGGAVGSAVAAAGTAARKAMMATLRITMNEALDSK